jgi:hypothetical protein
MDVTVTTFRGYGSNSSDLISFGFHYGSGPPLQLEPQQLGGLKSGPRWFWPLH